MGAQPCGDGERERRPCDQHVARVEVVHADQGQQCRRGQDRAADDKPDECGAPFAVIAAAPDEPEGEGDHNAGNDRRDDLAGGVEADEELLRRARDAVPERNLVNEVGEVERALMEQQRKQGQLDERERRRRHGDRPPVGRGGEQPRSLDRDQERRKVVRRQGERGHDRPEHERAPARVAGQQPDEEQEREPGEQDEQGVRARLLRVPDEHRVESGERSGHEADPDAGRARADRIDDWNERRSAERRKRPQAHLARPEHLGPQPCEAVVERGRGLAVGDPVEHVAEIHLDQSDGDCFVVPEALLVDGCEARDCRHGHDPSEHLQLSAAHGGELRVAAGAACLTASSAW